MPDVSTRTLTAGELRAALLSVSDDTLVYVQIHHREGDFPGYGGHALSAGVEDGRFLIASDEEEWKDSTADELSDDLDRAADE